MNRIFQEPNNRMEKDGPNRKSLREMLDDDRKIVAYLFMTCCIRVLDKEYGWTEEEVLKFNELLQDEIKNYRG